MKVNESIFAHALEAKNPFEEWDNQWYFASCAFECDERERKKFLIIKSHWLQLSIHHTSSTTINLKYNSSVFSSPFLACPPFTVHAQEEVYQDAQLKLNDYTETLSARARTKAIRSPALIWQLDVKRISNSCFPRQKAFFSC